MKKIVKWLILIGFVAGLLLCAVFFKVYSDMKQTAEEMYTQTLIEKTSERKEALELSKKEPFSLLLLGVDQRGKDAGRSDTMIVLTINPELETTKLLSIPRDTYTEIIEKNRMDKINHAYAFGGTEMSRKTVEQLLQIPIDYVVRVNMESFIDIVEIVGGITVTNAFLFDYEGEHFPKGVIELDGDKALKYVRMRYDDPAGDFGRQQRQKQVIQAVLKEGMSLQSVWNYQSIFKMLEKNVEMNVSFEELLHMRKNYGSSLSTIEQLYLTDGKGMLKNNIYYFVPDKQALEEIQQTLRIHLTDASKSVPGL